MLINQTYLSSQREAIRVNRNQGNNVRTTKMYEKDIDEQGTINGFIPNRIHSRDAAVVHLRYSKMGYGYELTTAAAIHDSFGFKLSEMELGKREVEIAMGEVTCDLVGERLIVNHDNENIKKAMNSVNQLMVGSNGITEANGFEPKDMDAVALGKERMEERMFTPYNKRHSKEYFHGDYEYPTYLEKISRGVKIRTKLGVRNT